MDAAISTTIVEGAPKAAPDVSSLELGPVRGSPILFVELPVDEDGGLAPDALDRRQPVAAEDLL